jgi:ADP-ribose pyrophosphatase YjhB (NUDIX family)
MRVYLSKTERAYVAMFDGDKILMTRNWLSNGRWALPGGGIKANESPENAVIREAKEEIAVDLNKVDLQLIGQGVWQTDRLGFRYKIFKTLYIPENYKANGHEITDVGWICIRDLNQLNTSSELLSVLKTSAQIK